MSMNITQQARTNSGERAWTIDWHPTGKFLASAGSSKNVTLWHYTQSSLQKHSTIETQHTKTIRCLKFSHKGDKLAIASFDQTISVWVLNPQNQQYQSLSILQGHANEVKCIAWSYDDKKIVSCSRDKSIWIWQFDNIAYQYVCEEVLREQHTQDVKYVDWFPARDDKLVSCSYDNTIKIWQYDDGQYNCIQTLQSHQSIVWNVQVCGNHIFSVSEDCTLIDWVFNQAKNMYQLSKVYQGLHFLPIYTLCVVNNKYLLTGGGDNYLCVTKITEQKNQNKYIQAVPVAKVSHESDINCIKQHPLQPTIVASCSDDETIRIWKLTQQ